MLILFPRRKEVKIATTLIFEMMGRQRSADYIKGAIAFALGFGAITKAEAEALEQHLKERG